MTNSDIREYCGRVYADTYAREKQKIEKEIRSNSKTGTVPVSKEGDVETSSQKEAIKFATMEGLKRFPDIEASVIWRTVYETHVHRKSGVDDADVIAKVVSADQSWKKSSGHAFEEMLKLLGSDALRESGIELLLQRDLNALIKAKRLNNEPRDVSFICYCPRA